MWSNFLDSRQPPGTKARHSISVMDWFLQEAKLMQSISVIQLVSASHSSQSRWHQPGSTVKAQGKWASLMLASWASPQPGFEETSWGCHRTCAQAGNFTQPLGSSTLTATCQQASSLPSFSLPHASPHTPSSWQKGLFSSCHLCTDNTFLCSHPYFMEPWGPMFGSHKKCFLQTRELAEFICQSSTRAGAWITLRESPGRSQSPFKLEADKEHFRNSHSKQK